MSSMANNAYFFDSHELPAGCYLELSSLLESNNFKFNFFSLSNFLQKKIVVAKAKQSFIFVNFSIDLLRKPESSVAKKFLKKVKKLILSTSSFKKIIFLFPNFPKTKDIDFSILEKIWSFLLPEASEHINKKIRLFLITPFEKSLKFPTCLHAFEDVAFDSPSSYFLANKNNNYEFLLAKRDLVLFGGLIENIRATPVEQSKINLFYQQLRNTLSRILGLSNARKPSNVQRSKTAIKKKFIWVDLDLTKSSKEIEELAFSTALANISGLWITPALNDLFSPQARFSDKKQQFLQHLDLFLREIKKNYKELEQPFPKIYFSIEIVNNLTEENYPVFQNKDIFKYSFYDQPDPLDETFWRSQIVDAVKSFKKDWSNPLQVAFGVVIDLEMYLRKTTALFSSVSGFTTANLQSFLVDQKLPVHSKVVFTKDAANIFKFLKKQAFLTGKKINKSLSDYLSENIAVYMPVFVPTWFYCSFLKGLSVGNKMPFFTFNVNLYPFLPGLKKAGLDLEVIEMFMLSKLNLKNWKDILKEQFFRADGICLNRFSRINDEYVPKDDNSSEVWFELEQAKSNLDKKLLIQELAALQ